MNGGSVRPARMRRKGIPRNVLVKNQKGEYVFVGRVHPKLALVNMDGKAPTDEQINVARRFGPQAASVKPRVFKTKKAALAAAKKLDVEVQVHGS